MACANDAAWAVLIRAHIARYDHALEPGPAQESARDTVQLECALDVVRQLVAGDETGWSADSVNRMFREAAAAGYPSVHRSDAFEAAYHPAYRVVSVTLVSAALP